MVGQPMCARALTLGSVIGVVPAGGGLAQDRLHDEKAHQGIHFCGPPPGRSFAEVCAGWDGRTRACRSLCDNQTLITPVATCTRGAEGGKDQSTASEEVSRPSARRARETHRNPSIGFDGHDHGAKQHDRPSAALAPVIVCAREHGVRAPTYRPMPMHCSASLPIADRVGSQVWNSAYLFPICSVPRPSQPIWGITAQHYWDD